MFMWRNYLTVCLLPFAGSLIAQSGFGLVGQPRAANVQIKRLPSEIAKQQAALAKEALHSIGEGSGTVGIWQRRLIEAIRNGGGDKLELIEALKHYVQTTRLNLKRVEGFSRNTSIGPKLREGLVQDAQYQALEAELWLANEEAR
jgi:hypothetical protein